MTQAKATLRKQLLQRRREISDEVRTKANMLATQYLLKWVRERATPIGSVVGLYWPTADEVDLTLAAKALRDYGLQLALPRVIEEEQPFVYCAWNGDDPTQTDVRGMLCCDGEQTSPDIIVTPMVGFTRQGHRLGRGKGDFDRSLVNWPDATRIGVAYACQEADIPHESHDVPMHFIITENGIFACQA